MKYVNIYAKKLFIIVLAVFVLSPITVFGQTYQSKSATGKTLSVNIVKSPIESRENVTNVTGIKPIVSSLTINTKNINTEIDNIYKSLSKASATTRAKSVEFDYKVFESDDYISILIIASTKGATVSEQVDAITFSRQNGDIIELSEVIGTKPIETVNSYVQYVLKGQDSYTKETTITKNSPFYLDKNALHLVFDAYTLSNKQTSYEDIVIDTSAITSFSLSKNDYYIKDKFNIRMIPLRKTSEGLYFDVKWIQSTRSFVVSNKSGLNSTGSATSNEYTINGKKVMLEYSPEIMDSTFYVPISYFTDVLGLSYKIDAKGDITFYKFK